MELISAVIGLLVLGIAYVHYRYNKSLYETQDRMDDATHLTKGTK